MSTFAPPGHQNLGLHPLPSYRLIIVLDRWRGWLGVKLPVGWVEPSVACIWTEVS